MADKLKTYRSKRDFKATPEPAGAAAGPDAARAERIFVVQKHAARHLHYDFRLEIDGSLKSWAVPKGPSLDPADKRMAVHVEDHPLAYAGFEGEIPAGHYGAGTVIVWDRGRWEPQCDARKAYAAGKLKFVLHGEKLQGGWTLVRMRGRGNERQEPWLLIKERDDAARVAAEYSVTEAAPESVLSASDATPEARAASKKAAKANKAAGGRAAAAKEASGAREAAATASATPAARKARSSSTSRSTSPASKPPGARRARLPLTLAPQLATLVDRVPASGDWRYEMKFDGYRLLARIDRSGVRLFTRNGHDWTAKLPQLAKALAAMKLGPAWLDGEIVWPDAQGVPDFQKLQNAFDARRTAGIVYFVFDLPYAGGFDLRALPLAERRERLQALLEGHAEPQVRYSEDFSVEAQSLLHTACQMRMEGVIGKRADAPYVSRRSADWIKLKCTQRQEFVIGGYTDPKGRRSGFGALLLGVHDEARALRYAGQVGTGFDTRRLAEIAEKLHAIDRPASPFESLPAGVRGHWVAPRLVAEVSFAEWTNEGRVRQAVFQGLRDDKPARAIGRERAVAPGSAPAATGSAPRAASKASPRAAVDGSAEAGKSDKSGKSGKVAAAPSATTLRLTHPERVIDASTGITKLELAQYYAKAARRLLPHLKARPVSLVRGPEGVGGQLFFQKHAGTLRIPGIRELDPAFDPGHDPLLEIATEKALLGAVQMNVMEFHTWNATTRSIDRPDRMVFDLDPGEGVKWPRMIEAAQLVKALLDELSLDALLKTSGGKGLHLVVPFRPSLGWGAVRGLSQAIVQHLAQTLPDRFVAKSGPKNRVGKIFADYLRNGRGATTAAAWSARARPGIGISVPLGWHELEGLRSGDQWTVRNIDERLALADPWKAQPGIGRQSLKTAMRVLDFTAVGDDGA